MNNCKKQFAFDLIADKNSPILQYYNSISGAYDAIEKYMKSHEFIHRQGSVYISENKMTRKDVSNFILQMCKELPWLSDCIKSFDVTNIGQQHDLTKDINIACEIYSDEKDKWINKDSEKYNNKSYEKKYSDLSFDDMCRQAKNEAEEINKNIKNPYKEKDSLENNIFYR